MKTITKEFWVGDNFFSFYNKGKAINEIINKDCLLEENEGVYYKNKITISFEVQEKQVTISESEFDELFCTKFVNIQSIKQKLFGD